MVKAQQVEERSVEIVDVNWFVDRGPAKIIGFADHLSAPYATTRHPGAEGAGVMIAPITALG